MASVKKTAALFGAVALGALALSAQSASAYVACNAAGDCWHTDHRYRAPGVTLQWHPDNYYFHRDWDHDHWRGHQEHRGYWRNGAWFNF